MEVVGLHHVAIAVDDLDEALARYGRLLGATVELRGVLESQGVEAAYLRLGSARIELVAPLAEDTPVGRFLAKRGPGMHHVALEVRDAAEAIQALEREGATLVDAEPRPGLGGHQVAFVHPDTLGGVLVEVIADG